MLFMDSPNTHNKSKMAGGRHFEKQKLSYLCNGLTDHHKIWFDDGDKTKG